MSKVRVLVGTKKGAFVLTSDGKREKWEVSGPHFAGWEIYHLKGSPADPNRLYASQTSGWFGQMIQRSDDGGKTWFQPGTPPGEATALGWPRPKGESNKFVYDTSPQTGAPLTTHQFYDGTQHPVGVQARLAPGAIADRSRYGLCRASKTQRFLKPPTAARPGKNSPDCADTPPAKWQPGAGGMCLHTIVLDPKNANRIFVAISAAGAFRSDDGGKNWKPINKGLKSPYQLPDPDAEVGHCVHRIARQFPRPERAVHAKTLGRDALVDAGDTWSEVSGNLPTDFGFVIDVHAHEPKTIYVVPIKSDSEHFPLDGKLRVYRSRAAAMNGKS